ncbi:unnamed protein product [Haemonchus placei]|uniref:Uncharacterized protein n=1 Tax=Haemonchus placei TaxID=6290 RepID=A0A0N4X4Y9_HAEPC|nr:unnamed protein product [Haemonchus placei]
MGYTVPFHLCFDPSAINIASKSSSDGEDPLAHGLDPALYGPNAPVTCASPCTSDPGAVPSSSSFSGSEPRPTGLGLLHCLLQHFPVRKRLRVSILKIEGLDIALAKCGGNLVLDRANNLMAIK